jgi:HD-GYP domain-containing protein (c-di-GMP phosphodiesterase class II)
VIDARLAEIVASLALAAEAAAGVPEETSSRAAIAAVAIAEALGLSLAERSEAFYAALLRYIGCTSYAHETAWLGSGDDIGLLAALGPIDAANPAELARAVFGRAGRGTGALGRARSVARVLSSPSTARRLAEAHCAQAVALARDLRLSEGVLDALGGLYERWDGKGGPRGLSGERIGVLARVLRVAYAMVLHGSIEGPAAGVAVLKARRGGELDPAIVDATLPLARGLLERLFQLGASMSDELLVCEPAPFHSADAARVAEVAAAFATCVDLKSPFLLGHSQRVAELCAAAVAGDGGSEEEQLRARVAGLLHDLGRASVPNGIWDKPTKLSPFERQRVERHAAESERIAARTPLLAPYASVVGAHHERVDGSGYPRHAPAANASPLARVLAVADVFAALGEERPHRSALSDDAAIATLLGEVKAGRLDRDAAHAVLRAAGARVKRRAAFPCELSEREVEVLLWVARGLTNPQIGAKLFISPRTVGHHLAHIYDKTDARTRAAAALFAVRHGLVDAAATAK